jgi:N6-L-threonylcarbamoyladenine synthase
MKAESIIAIETSCDETAVAVVSRGEIKSSLVSSQVDLHAVFGGVVPEIASRTHLQLIDPLIKKALSEARDSIDAVAATKGPGLIGALLVGMSAAKALSVSLDLPFVAVNHHEAHLFAAWLEAKNPPELPALVLLVSGGHSMLVLIKDFGSYILVSKTLDDAAGEAFDKVARYLGLGYPGGPAIEKAAESGDDKALALPKPYWGEDLNFSFSGIKTAVIRAVEKAPGISVEDVSASFQKTVVDFLIEKTKKAAQIYKPKSIVLAGGVAANTLLRSSFGNLAAELGIQANIPEKRACTDNAAMVAAAGLWQLNSLGPSSLFTGADPNLEIEFER